MGRRILLIASTLLLLSCDDDFEEVAFKLGYTYDQTHDIYVSRVNAWQRKAGYDFVVDQAAMPAGMVIDCEPVRFVHGGMQYMIELWKGQYDLSTGSEIGIYKRAEKGPMKWKCGDDADMLLISYTLKKNGNLVFARKGVHWWLTGFKPGEFANPAELVMDVAIDFARNPGMQQPFVAELTRLGYAQPQIEGTVVRFVFDKPKTPQPPGNPALVAATQDKNRLLVKSYNDLKAEVGVTDNSPASLEKVLKRSPGLALQIVKAQK